MNETVDPATIERAKPAPSPPTLKRSRAPRLLFWLLVLAVGAGLGYKYYWAPQPAAQTNSTGRFAGGPPQSVHAVAAAIGDMPITINALGTVTPLATVTVKTQVAGRLMSVGFQEGQIVKPGDFLAQIDDRPFVATLAQAQAQLAKDTALRDQAQSDYQRYQKLSQQDSIALQQVVDQKFLIAQDQAAMATDQAQIDAAKLNIEYAHITAPTGGRVGLRQVDPGNYVQPTDTTGIVVLTELDPISVIFSIPEDDLQRVAKRLNAGEKLTATVYDRANVHEIAQGELTSYDNEVDTATGTFKLRATFANSNNALFPSQFVNVRLLVDTLKGVVVVPNAAVQIGPSGSFVYVVGADNTVSVRKLTTGPSDARRIVVASGLKAGEQVVVDGVDRLRDGARVKEIANDAGASPSPSSDATKSGAQSGSAEQNGGRGWHHRHQQGGETGAASPSSSPSHSPVASATQ